MSTSKFGLGKGINSLIQGYDNSNFETEKLVETGSKVEEIDITHIFPNPDQPRKTFDSDSMNELAQSISNQGVLQPILVEQTAPNRYMIIAGERRFRAAKIADLKKMPCIIRSFSDIQRVEVALIENIQRENLNIVEEAKAYQYLLSHLDIKQDELAIKLGKSRPAITNTLRLLQLPAPMLNALQEGAFTPGHARALLSVINPADQMVLYNKIISDGISVREAEALSVHLNKGGRASDSMKELNTDEIGVKPDKSEDILYVEEKFLTATGFHISVKGNLRKGKVVIPFKTEHDLEAIYRLFNKNGGLFDGEDDL